MAEARVRSPPGALLIEATPPADTPSCPSPGPGGPLDAPVEQWLVHHSVTVEARVQFPSGALCFEANEWHGAPTGRAAELKPRKVWVRIPPVLLRRQRAGWALASPRACKAPAFAVQVQLLPDAFSKRLARLCTARTPVPQTGKRGSTPLRAISISEGTTIPCRNGTTVM
jgi:hypothetical protein